MGLLRTPAEVLQQGFGAPYSAVRPPLPLRATRASVRPMSAAAAVSRRETTPTSDDLMSQVLQRERARCKNLTAVTWGLASRLEELEKERDLTGMILSENFKLRYGGSSTAEQKQSEEQEEQDNGLGPPSMTPSSLARPVILQERQAHHERLKRDELSMRLQEEVGDRYPFKRPHSSPLKRPHSSSAITRHPNAQVQDCGGLTSSASVSSFHASTMPMTVSGHGALLNQRKTPGAAATVSTCRQAAVTKYVG